MKKIFFFLIFFILFLSNNIKAESNYMKAKKLYAELENNLFNEYSSEKIKEICEKIINISENSEYGYISKAWLSYFDNKYDDAIKFIENALDKDANINSVYLLRGLCYNRNKKFIESIEDFNLVIKINPTHFVYANRANSYSWLRKHDEALDDYNKAISLSPKNPDYYFERGVLYKNMGKWEKAKNDLNEVINLGGKDSWIAGRMIMDIDNIYIPESEGKKWNSNKKKYE